MGRLTISWRERERELLVYHHTHNFKTQFLHISAHESEKRKVGKKIQACSPSHDKLRIIICRAETNNVVFEYLFVSAIFE